MQTLSYGYKKPQNTDTGDVFFPAMEFNIQRLNDHTHDGVNSAALSSKSQPIAAASWAAVAGINGVYVQTVTLPAGYTYDSVDLWFKLSTGEFVYPSVERVDAQNFKIYTNNNALAYVVYFR